jgi:phosphoribosylformylglycinamidine synthase subunit PurL
VAALIAAGRVSAVHDVSGGGVLVALARMALAGGIGITLDTTALPDAAAAFGEGQGRYLVTMPADAMCDPGVAARRIGMTGGTLVAGVTLADLRDANEGALPAMLKGEL